MKRDANSIESNFERGGPLCFAMCSNVLKKRVGTTNQLRTNRFWSFMSEQVKLLVDHHCPSLKFQTISSGYSKSMGFVGSIAGGLLVLLFSCWILISKKDGVLKFLQTF